MATKKELHCSQFVAIQKEKSRKILILQDIRDSLEQNFLFPLAPGLFDVNSFVWVNCF